jgi:hypothetical protein
MAARCHSRPRIRGARAPGIPVVAAILRRALWARPRSVSVRLPDSRALAVIVFAIRVRGVAILAIFKLSQSHSPYRGQGGSGPATPLIVISVTRADSGTSSEAHEHLPPRACRSEDRDSSRPRGQGAPSARGLTSRIYMMSWDSSQAAREYRPALITEGMNIINQMAGSLCD